MPPKPRQVRMESKSALNAMQQLETRSDEELEKETRFKAAAQAILGTRAAERMDAAKSREHFRAAIAASRPQERLQLRRMAEASLALAERRAGDLKVATEKLGGTPPTNRQLLMLRVMGVIAPPPSAGLPRRIGGVLLVILAIILVIVVGWGIVKLVALPFGGARQHARGSTASCWSSWCSASSPSSAGAASGRPERKPPSNAPRHTAASARLTFPGGRAFQERAATVLDARRDPRRRAAGPRAPAGGRRRPRTSCRTRCCARCGPIRSCVTPTTCAPGSTA